MRLLPDVQLGPSALEFFGRTCNQFVTFDGAYADWDDAHIPRTSDPIRFDYRRVSVWCSPTKQFESATWTEEQRILNYYRQRGI